MSNLNSLNERIRDRLGLDWLTPSQKAIWEMIQRYDGPPHRVLNIYGGEGSGKSFLGWLMERQQYATYSLWGHTPQPTYPRLVLDNAMPDRAAAREIRPWVDQYNLRQIILFTRTRVDEQAMPAFELRVLNEDIEHFRANLYRYLRLTVPEGEYRNYKAALEAIAAQ